MDHSLISSVDWLPTVASIAGISSTIPAGTLLRGEDVSDIFHGKTSHKTVREKPLWWRGGGGPAPCWNRSPSLAVRNGDWKLLLNPDYATGGPNARVELYNMSVHLLASGGTNGGFFETQNEASRFPEVVSSMAKGLLDWHHAIGPEHPNRTDAQQSAAARGCEKYPFPM